MPRRLAGPLVLIAGLVEVMGGGGPQSAGGLFNHRKPPVVPALIPSLRLSGLTLPENNLRTRRWRLMEGEGSLTLSE